MKLILFGLAFVAIAAGKQYLPPLEEPVEVEAQYLPPEQEAVVPEPDNQYLAPIEAAEPIEQLAEDGYRYKTVKRLRYRNRRDVNELSSGQYLPPSLEDSYGPPPSGPVPVPISAPAPIQDSAVLADDGYRYKTVRRIRYRHRRDVNELASAQYLPPAQDEDSYSYPAAAPVVAPAPIVATAPIAPVEIAAPAQVEIPAPVVISAPAPVQQSAELADDGYRYKTVKRIRYRHRRDVNELSSAQYLPPPQEDDSYSYPAPAPIVASAPVAPIEIAAPALVEIPAPVVISAPASVQESAELADDGYRYKTVKRIRYRHRRDVNELSSSQYLPPPQEDDSYSYPAPAPIVAQAPVAAIEIAAPAPVEIPAPIVISAPASVQQSAELADDGYRYKTVKRIRYRHRRDVNELSSAQYLPPAQEDDSYSYPAPAPLVAQAPVAPIEIAAPAPAPVEIPAPVVVSAPASVQQSAELADDGYRYKTVKRIRYRHRRDVNELSSAQYLPPVQEDDSYSYPAPAPIVAPASVATIEIAAPAPAPVEIPAPVVISAPVQQSAELADDGYRYKTVKRIRYRHRRDVNELSSAQYLPPSQEDDNYSYPAPAPIAAQAPVAAIEIAAPAPVEIPAPVVISAPASVQQSAELADDGYRYKTIKRIRYRNRRDVNELSSSQYLPPPQEDDSYSYPAPAPIVAPAPVAPIEIAAPAPVEIPAPVVISAPAPVQQSAELADDGYRYKTVKRIRYRHRRDVNELSSAQYLPPSQEDGSYSYPAPAPFVAPAPVAPAPVAQIEIAAPAPAPVGIPAPVEIPAPVVISAPVQQTAELADDGYHYKTVRRIRYRHRRDVNEIPSYDYVPPASAPAPIVPISAPAPVQSDYSYPAPAPVEISAPIDIAPVVQESAPLADDGYRYKTVRRIRYRHRRDVNEIPTEYLPPTQEFSYEEPSNQYLAPIAAVEPIEQVAQDGYRYKTVKKFKIKRH